MIEYKLIPEEELTKTELLKIVHNYEDKTKELESQLKFAFNISENEIKQIILKFIKKAEDENHKEAAEYLKDLFKAIYVVPDDIFETMSIEEMIENVMQSKEEYSKAVFVRALEDAEVQ